MNILRGYNMEINSILYIIEDAYFEKWFSKIAKTDEGNHLDTMLQCEKLLQENITNEYNEILKKYIRSTSSYYETRLFKMCEEVLNMGIKIGMHVQKIISE